VRLKVSCAVLGVGIVVVCAAAWPFVKAHLQAIAVMREVAGQPVPWMARALTVPVTTRGLLTSKSTPTGKQVVRARLYLPQGKPNAPAMVIFHGVHHLGIDEPRLMGFARRWRAAASGC
jgi:acetyl esterase/lipase